MNNSEMLISIGMPVFNDRLFIRKSIESILDQTYQNFELIISDDGSTDGSESICREFASADPRIRYIRQPQNIGVSRNMQYLLKEARGKYFMWAGNDDVLAPEFIKELKKNLDQDPNAVLAFGPTIFIDEEDNHLEQVRTDYSGRSAHERLLKLIRTFEDSCGYGLFLTDKIKDVEFPVWWSVNRKRAYNNIYPTICYYLAKGQYVFSNSRPLFYKRMKDKHVNHRVPFTGSFLKGIIAFLLWKVNMVYFSLRQVFRASRSWMLTLRVMPEMTWRWLVLPSIEMFGKRYASYRKGQMKFW